MPTVIKSVGRILAYLLDSRGEEKKLSAVTMPSFTFSLLKSCRCQMTTAASRQPTKNKKMGGVY